VLNQVGVCPLFLFKALPVPVGDVVERVREIAGRIAASYGLEIYDVQYRREGPGLVLRVRLDRPWHGRRPDAAEESVTVEDCARISRDLSAILDVEDVVPGAYVLEVSSPGLDRPIRNAAEYSRFEGRRAKVVVREAIDGQMFFKGRLGGMEEGDVPAVIIVTDDGRRHRVPIGAITRANLEVEFQ
jgi:ribosome maturation factor RimP